MAKAKTTPADLVRAKKNYVHVQPMVMDSLLVEQRDRLEEKLTSARRTYSGYRRLPDENPMKMEAAQTLAELEDRARKLDAEIAAQTVEFTFRGLSRAKYRRLNKDHPPSDAEREEFARAQQEAGRPSSEQKGPRVSDETYPPALLALTLVEPEFSEEELNSWFNDDDSPWSAAELQLILTAAEKACNLVALPRQ